MKKTFITVILFTAITCTTQAQSSTKKERIQYLFSLMHQDSMMSKMAATMGSYMAKTMKANEKDVEGASIYDSARSTKIMKLAMENMKKLMADVMVDSYDSHFTSAEIEDYITFYQSKSGQKMLLETPAIANEIMMATAAKNQEFIKKVMEEQ